MYLSKILRRRFLNKGNFGKYLLYAIGEITIILIGIFLAIRLNQYAENRSNEVKQNQYLNDLYIALEQDSKFIEEEKFLKYGKYISQINQYDRTNIEKTWKETDSLWIKLRVVMYGYDPFKQASKSKIEEIKYSNINLVENDELRNKIIHYQDETIFTLRSEEEMIIENQNELRKYCIDYISPYFYNRDNTIDKYKALTNPRFLFLMYERRGKDEYILYYYKETLLKENEIIRNLIKEELKKELL